MMQKIYLTILVSVCFALGNLSGQDLNLNDPVPPDPEIRIGRLENGLTYYIKQNSKPEKRIELRLAVNAGSICETDNEQGLAHFTEHMSFNGTKNFPGNKMIDELEEIGVRFGDELNASTGFDQTVFMLKVPTGKPEWIERGFRVLGDWAHGVSFDDNEIKKERGVVVEEWRMGLGAEERMMQKYLPVLFRGSKYASRLPIGKVDILESFNNDTLRRFYSKWYRPDLMAVVVVGDIDPAIAENKVKEYFSNIPVLSNPVKRIDYPVPGNSEPLVSIVTDKEATGYTAEIMFKHPKTGSVTYGDYRKMLMQSLYTGMLDDRLIEMARKPDAPFLSAGSGYGSFIGRLLDVYSLSVNAKENQIEKSIDAVVTENERARRFGFTPSELERQKSDMLSLYENSAKEAAKTGSDAFADEFVRNYLTKESIPGYRNEYELVKRFLPGISLAEINDLGRSWTTDDNMLVLLTAQEKAGVRVPAEKDVEQIIASARSKELKSYIDDVPDQPLLPSDPVPSHVVTRTENAASGYSEIVFGNGARVILKPTDFSNDEILFSASSPGGISLYPDSDLMSASFASAIISQSGLGSFDQTTLQKKLAGNTASIKPYIGEIREGLTGSCSPADLETLLQLNYLYFTGVRKDEDAFGSFISRMKNGVKPLRTNPQVIFTDTLAKIVSMNSPRIVTVPTDRQINSINLDRALAIFRDRFADAGDFTFVMVGNFQTDDVVRLLEKYIGGLPSSGRIERWRDLTPKFPSNLVRVDVPVNSEPQSIVALVWKGKFNMTGRNRQAFSMLMDILSIRCRESMREDQGGVYGVSIDGSASRYPEPRFSVASSWGCSPDRVSELTGTLLGEMDRIRKRGPEEEDLNKVKQSMIRANESMLKENNYWIAALQNHIQNGDPLRSATEYESFVNSFTTKDIMAIASKYLDTKKYVGVTLTPTAKTTREVQH